MGSHKVKDVGPCVSAGVGLIDTVGDGVYPVNVGPLVLGVELGYCVGIGEGTGTGI